MILDDLKVMPNADSEWVTRVRRGHFVWMAKEKNFAKVEWAYEAPDPGSWCGRIGLRPCWRNDYQWGMGALESWYVQLDGRGLDGSLILLPVEGNLPNEPPPISDVWQRHVERRLDILTHELEQMRAQMRAISTWGGLYE